MTTQTTSATTTSTPRPRLYRTAGVAALIGAAAYLLQPILVFLLIGDTVAVDTESLAGIKWEAPYEVFTFTAVGVATLFLVMAVGSLLGDSSAAKVTTALGVVGAIGWFGSASGTIQLFGLTLNALPDTEDPALQELIISQAHAFIGAILGLALIGMTGWLVGLALVGRKSGAVGVFEIVVAVVGALVIGVPALVLSVPFGALALIPVFIALGIAFLLRSRRA